MIVRENVILVMFLSEFANVKKELKKDIRCKERANFSPFL